MKELDSILDKVKELDRVRWVRTRGWKAEGGEAKEQKPSSSPYGEGSSEALCKAEGTEHVRE